MVYQKKYNAIITKVNRANMKKVTRKLLLYQLYLLIYNMIHDGGVEEGISLIAKKLPHFL